MAKTQELIIISQVYYNGFGCYIFRSLLWNQSQALRSVYPIKIKSIFKFSHGAQLGQWLHSCRFPSSQPATTVGLKSPLPWQQDFLILSNQKLIHEQIRLIKVIISPDGVTSAMQILTLSHQQIRPSGGFIWRQKTPRLCTAGCRWHSKAHQTHEHTSWSCKKISKKDCWVQLRYRFPHAPAIWLQ